MKKLLPVILYTVLIIYLDCLLVITSTRTNNYPYSLYLDRAKTLQLSWRVDYREDVVYFRLTAKVTPVTWFGAGFSDYGDPEDGDYFVFWTDSEQQHHFQVCKLLYLLNFTHALTLKVPSKISSR